MKKYILPLLAFFVLGGPLFAQNAHVRNPANAPLLYNAGFAGSMDQYRLALAYRIERIYINKAAFSSDHSFYASYDQVSNMFKGAFGFEVSHNNLSTFNETRASGIYAAKINLGPNWTLSPALKFGYQTWRFKLVSYDTFGEPAPQVIGRDGLDFSPGVLINSPNFYFGINSEYLASIPLRELKDGPNLTTRPNRIWRFQAGYNFQPESERWSLAATGLVASQQSYLNLYGQLMFNWDWLLVGTGIYALNVDVTDFNGTVSAGFKHRYFRVMALYEMGLFRQDSPVRVNSLEFSLMLYLPRKKSVSSPEVPQM